MHRRSALAHLLGAATTASTATLAGLAPLAPARAADASRHRYAVLSLVGRRMDVITFVWGTGTRLDNNKHETLQDQSGRYDEVVVRTLGKALKEADAGCATDLLDADLPDVVATLRDLKVGETLALPAADARDIASGGTTHLVLLAPHRADLVIKMTEGSGQGKGRAEGIGFYYDNATSIRDLQTGEPHTGFCAAFAHVRLCLLSTSDWRLVASRTLETNHFMWRSATPQQRVDSLAWMLTEELPAMTAGLLKDAGLAARG